MTLTAYLAGPMRGHDEYNFPAFHAAAESIRDWYKNQIELLCPHEHDLENGFDPKLPLEDQDFDLREAMGWDIAAVLRSSMVFVLPGWEKSRGAQAEVAVAASVGIPVFRADNFHRVYFAEAIASVLATTPIPEPVDETVTDEAHRIVYGDRAAQYGPPTEDFARTAQMWTAVLGMPVTAKQVALCMVLLKVSREIHKPKRDNVVDIIGYALCAYRVETNS